MIERRDDIGKRKALLAEGYFERNKHFNRSDNMSTKYNQEKIDFNHLNRQINLYFSLLLKQLLPCGRLENHEYVALNPTRHDKHLGSFRINTFTGKWSDFATGDKGGDFISLWAYVKGISQTDAARALQVIVGGV